jgi:hypothetical protein
LKNSVSDNLKSGFVHSIRLPPPLPLPPLLPLLLLLLNAARLSMDITESNYMGQAPVSWFRTDTGRYLFKTSIDVMKNHFSGLMVVKPLACEANRVVFITEMGMKIFDIEFFPDKSVTVHYIMEAMNRKVLVKTLTRDIGLVLMNGLAGSEPRVLKDRSSLDIVYRYRDNGRKSDYRVARSDSLPYHVVQHAGITNKVQAHFFGHAFSGIDSIKISHYNIRLNIDLYRLFEESNHAAE